MRALLWLVLIVVAGWGFIALVGHEWDKNYEFQCVQDRNCDAAAIDHFDKMGCEILGDAYGHRWAECDLK